MPIVELQKLIYVFIRSRNDDSKNTYWNPHIKLFVLHTGRFSLQDGGYALQELKKKGAVRFSKKYGWLVN